MLLPPLRRPRGRDDDCLGQLLPVQLRRPQWDARLGRDRGRVRDIPCGRRRDTVLRSAGLHEEEGSSRDRRHGFFNERQFVLISAEYHHLIERDSQSTRSFLISRR